MIHLDSDFYPRLTSVIEGLRASGHPGLADEIADVLEGAMTSTEIFLRLRHLLDPVATARLAFGEDLATKVRRVHAEACVVLAQP